jgi:CheY-like chemotaxis protein
VNYEASVLVVDREEQHDFIVPLIAQTLQTTQIHLFDSIDPAIDFLNQKQRIDIGFCGWDIGGKYLLSEIQKSTHLQHIPIVIMSENESDAVLAEAVRNKARDVLPKPFSESDFEKCVQQIMIPLERRQTFRVTPPQTMTVMITLQSGESLPLQMESLSVNGCQLRVPFELRHKMTVYDDVAVEINEGAVAIQVDAVLFRISQASHYQTIAHDLLLTLRFKQLSQDDEHELENILADLSLGTKQQHALIRFKQIYSVD